MPPGLDEMQWGEKALWGIYREFVDDHQFLSWVRPFSGRDASTVFAELNGARNQLPMPDLPEQVVGTPPDTPSCYSDGSASLPNHPCFSLSTAGVWHPGRHLEHSPLAVMEEALSLDDQRPEGLELYAYLDGHPTSSSRSELVGLILSLFAPVPLHVALDSAAVLHPAQAILSFLLDHHDVASLVADLPSTLAEY
eukprot:9651431-Karenia_brevis.AAC.1